MVGKDVDLILKYAPLMHEKKSKESVKVSKKVLKAYLKDKEIYESVGLKPFYNYRLKEFEIF